MDMHVPAEFLVFSSGFHQDVFELHSSVEEILGHALELLTEEERIKLKSFIRILIDSNLTDEQILELWNNSRSDFYAVNGGQIRALFLDAMTRIPEK
ncbi:MAG: hypothetical protein MI920_31175 [Kiloniellales bacterium]|nr:hypothetical protein [Kiloniellales bacterium]